MTADHFLPDSSYDRLVTAFLNLDRDHYDLRTVIQTALGEIGGIWPASVAAETLSMKAHAAGFTAAVNGRPFDADDQREGYAKGYNAGQAQRAVWTRPAPVAPKVFLTGHLAPLSVGIVEPRGSIFTAVA